MQDFKSCVFGSVARKRVTGANLGCVANERLSGLSLKALGVNEWLLDSARDKRVMSDEKKAEERIRAQRQSGVAGARLIDWWLRITRHVSISIMTCQVCTYMLFE